MRCIFLFIIICCSITLQAQIIQNPNQSRSIKDINRSVNDTILNRKDESKPSDSLKIYNPVITDYQIKTSHGKYSRVDTTLTLDAYYRKNEYQKDLFQYQEPVNMGLALNPLTLELNPRQFDILPAGKAFMYKPVESIKYYNVKTPLTQFIFENGVQEGQYLSTTFTHNIHDRWNYAINYDYLNSMGRYLYTDVKNTSFLFNTHYKTKSNRYKIQATFISHDLNNNENGGLTAESLQAYIDNEPNFTNRQNMFSNMQGASTNFDERRVQLQQQFGILSFNKKNDSITASREFPIFIKHQMVYKHQAFQYNEPKDNPQKLYDTILVSDKITNRKKLDNLTNKVTLGYEWSDRLNVQGGIIHQIIKPYYDNINTYVGGAIPASTIENRFGAVAALSFQWKENIQINGTGEITQGSIFGNAYNLNADIALTPFKNYQLKGGIKLNSSFPNLNYFYNQSFYNQFNYYNQDLENQSTQEIHASLSSHNLGLNIFGKILNVNNYTYINSKYDIEQAQDALKYFSIGAREHYKINKFGIDVTAQYQKVIENQELYPVPQIIARATLYYQDKAFKNNMNYMVGLSTHYFSKFKSREFFPILNEFNLQNSTNPTEIGGYPQIDLFLNMRVRRMRIYLRTQNINSFLMPGQNLYTPNQPSRDFKIQLGIHWFLFS